MKEVMEILLLLPGIWLVGFVVYVKLTSGHGEDESGPFAIIWGILVLAIGSLLVGLS